MSIRGGLTCTPRATIIMASYQQYLAVFIPFGQNSRHFPFGSAWT